MPGIHMSVLGVNTWLTRSFAGRACPTDSSQPCHCYLTLPEDGSTKMFINVHVGRKQFEEKEMDMQYWEIENGSKKVMKTMSLTTTSEWLEENGKRDVYSILLEDLKPQTVYEFALPNAFPKMKYKFKTLPGGNEPFTFMAGGDSGTTTPFENLLAHSAQNNIDFAIIGGDISYGNNLEECYHCWDTWLSTYEKHMISNGDKTMIPLSLAVGNHDVGANAGAKVFANSFDIDQTDYWKGGNVPLLFAWFPQQSSTEGSKTRVPPINHRPPYHYHKIGQSAVIFMLDSGHVVTHESQKAWVETVLAQLPIKQYKVKMASYHTPIYPSTREWNEDGYVPIQDGLKYWVSPVFDKYKFQAVFEHHQHTFKRTLPLTNSKYNEVDGVVYLGDGDLGITGTHRFLHGNQLVAKVNSKNHAYIVHVNSKMSNFTAIDTAGQVFDFVLRKVPNINKPDDL
eukprot:g15096.t1